MFPITKRMMVMGGLRYWQRIANTHRDNLLYWPLWDAAGRVCDEITGKAVAATELLYNTGFETAGAGGADVFANWSEFAGTGVIADEGVVVHAGSHAAKLTAGTTRNTTLNQFINVLPGQVCTLSLWTQGDGTNAGRYQVRDQTNNADITALTSTGVTGAAYANVAVNFTVPATCYQVNIIVQCPNVNAAFCYFDDVSVTVTRSLDGIYQPSGITYGVAGIGDGRTCLVVNGTDSAVLIGTKAFNSLWNGNVGSSISWARVDGAARWTDATTYRYPFHVKSRPDATVYLAYGRSQTNHQISWRRRCAGAAYEKTYTFAPTGTLDWFCMGMVWDLVSSPQRIATFLYTKADGIWQKVTDEAPASGNETWNNATYPVDDVNASLLGGSTGNW